MSDNDGGAASSTVAITITGTNDSPIFDAAASNLTGTLTASPQPVSAPLTAVAVGYLTAGNSMINNLGGAHGFGEHTVDTGDDNSTSAINFESVFGSAGINFFGVNYTSLYINNNGNISFSSTNGSFTPSSINGAYANPIIAPFWGDVDTRGGNGFATDGGTSTGSNQISYDLDSINHVMTITYNDVGYYNSSNNKLNAFQIQLVGTGDGNFDIIYRYENINWTTGSASGGTNGLGGSIARAGYSAGNSTNYYELSQSGNQSGMLGLSSAIGNTGILGVHVFEVVNGQVTGSADLTQTGTISFSDADLSNAHLLSLNAAPVGSTLGSLSAVLNSDTTGTEVGRQATWNYSVSEAALATLGAGETRVENFDITVDDQYGGVINENVSVVLVGLPDG
jgi:VCBS repeat-containing protein